jgi:hypothetical protein
LGLEIEVKSGKLVRFNLLTVLRVIYFMTAFIAVTEDLKDRI